ncbi:murein biosynthesis integral membrane protein MurJ [Asticcacaulis sp. 201]|uniref:murein biosynthesis integral membrane protein MurJ n=1 Tax=Asticcacaulis sp. 201 TaxID=3028787 RepID=UPI0029162E84|nr:murein biosynthesis integral membrane protein MurJ [Asticcacaulis sp. 201]MDV6331507.1 murein biosynthesis integral membrane protein MurJ [Asticcacaulis sp. 201]
MPDISDAPAKPAPAKSSGLVRNSLINSFFTLISRFMGLARDLVITAVLGASGNIAADAYYTALSFPNLFRRIFAEGAFTAAFVPSYSAVLVQEGEAAADKLARDAMATLAFATLVLTLIAQLTMPWLMHVINPGYFSDPVKFKLAITLTQITMPYLPCMALVALMSGVLNARGRFIVSAAVPTVLNAVMLIAVWPQHDPLRAAYAASWGVLAAGVIQAGLLFWGVRRVGARIGISFMPRVTPDIRKLMVLAIPGALAAAATQINVFVSQAFSSAVPGARSWLNVADRLYQLPLGLVGVAIGVALLPALSRAVQAQDHESAQNTMDDALIFSMALTLPAAAALVSIPFFLIDGLFTRGQFNIHDAQQTAAALLHYGWGVPAFVLTRILSPAFYARKNTFGPMKFALVNVAVNLGLGVTLFHFIGVPGLAIGTSAGAWANVILMLISLIRRKMWHLSPRSAAGLTKVMIAGVGMAAFLALCSTYRPFIQAQIAQIMPHLVKEIAILGVCFAGLFLYIGLLFVTGAVKSRDLKAMLRRR